MKLSHLLLNLDVLEIKGQTQKEVLSVCYDSQKCDSDSLFVAVSGFNRDGHDYIPDAAARGAHCVIHEKDYVMPPGVTAIKVRDARRSLGVVGKNFYGNPSAGLCLIGVMGTNGKTTVTYLLENILRCARCKVGVLGTVNYRYLNKVLPAPNTTPESFEFQKILREMADAGISHVVAEVSSHAVDLKRVDDCAFDLGVFTNLTQDHLDYHHTMEKYFQAKFRFFREILPASGKPGRYKMIINGDDAWGQRILQECPVPALTFGIEKHNSVRTEDFSLSSDGIRAKIMSPFGAFSIFSPLLGRYNLSNILAAAAAAGTLQIPGECIKEGIEGLRGIPGRLERINHPGEPAVFVDYAHTNDALLRVLQNLAEFNKAKIITVFGCGGNRDRGKRPLMAEAAVAYSAGTIITNDNPRKEDPLEIIREIEAGIDQQIVRKILPEEISGSNGTKWYTVIPDRRQAIAAAVQLAQPGDTVLIAGKGHEDYQILGERRIFFDDRQVARKALDEKRSDQG